MRIIRSRLLPCLTAALLLKRGAERTVSQAAASPAGECFKASRGETQRCGLQAAGCQRRRFLAAVIGLEIVRFGSRLALGPLPSVESELLPQQSRAQVVTRIIKSRSCDGLDGTYCTSWCGLLEKILCFCLLPDFSSPISSINTSQCSMFRGSVSANTVLDATAAQWIPDFPSRRSTSIGFSCGRDGPCSTIPSQPTANNHHISNRITSVPRPANFQPSQASPIQRPTREKKKKQNTNKPTTPCPPSPQSTNPSLVRLPPPSLTHHPRDPNPPFQTSTQTQPPPPAPPPKP